MIPPYTASVVIIFYVDKVQFTNNRAMNDNKFGNFLIITKYEEKMRPKIEN